MQIFILNKNVPGWSKEGYSKKGWILVARIHRAIQHAWLGHMASMRAPPDQWRANECTIWLANNEIRAIVRGG